MIELNAKQPWWRDYTNVRVIERDASGMALCEVTYRRWHPGYWLMRLRTTISPPRGVAMPADGSWSEPIGA